MGYEWLFARVGVKRSTDDVPARVLQFVSIDFVAAVSIETKALAAAFATRRVRVNDLRHALYATEVLGNRVVQIDEEIAVVGRWHSMTQYHGARSWRIVEQRVPGQRMWYECAVAEGPELAVQVRRRVRGCSVDMHHTPERKRFRSEATGHACTRGVANLRSDVKIDAGQDATISSDR